MAVVARDGPQDDGVKMERLPASRLHQVDFESGPDLDGSIRAQECAVGRELFELTGERGRSLPDVRGDSADAEAVTARLCIRHQAFLAAESAMPPGNEPRATDGCSAASSLSHQPIFDAIPRG